MIKPPFDFKKIVKKNPFQHPTHQILGLQRGRVSSNWWNYCAIIWQQQLTKSLILQEKRSGYGKQFHTNKIEI